jgi:hypothetical protein
MTDEASDASNEASEMTNEASEAVTEPSETVDEGPEVGIPVAGMLVLRHDRRKFSLRIAGIDALPQPAVAEAVEKINQQTDSEPNEEAHPGFDRQT